MKRGKSLFITVFSFLLMFVMLCAGCGSRRKAGDDLYAEIRSAFAEYPSLSAPYGYTSLYYCEDSTEYLLLKNGGAQISGIRYTNGETLYYMDGHVWQVDDSGALVATGEGQDPVAGYVGAAVQELLAEPNITYSYAVANDTALPLWAFSGAPYLTCDRMSYPDCFEYMSCKNTETGHRIIWDIARSDTDVVLFVYLDSQLDKMPSWGRGAIPGWGDVDQCVSQMLFEATFTDTYIT